MVACFRLGLVALPCTEQLRAEGPRAAPRGRPARGSWLRPAQRRRARGRRLGRADAVGAVGRAGRRPGPAARRPRARRPVPDHVHLRHLRRAEGRAPRPALPVRPDAAGPPLARRPAGDLVWCTAASGWSKSARNVFIAPWLRGAAALLHDARFDPHERLELLERERVDLLCMAPTEYRVIAKRATLRGLIDLRGAVAAGEALNPRCWAPGTRRPTSGSATATARPRPASSPACRWASRPARARWASPLPGVRLDVDDGELVADPATIPTFFLGYLGEDRRRPGRRDVAHRRPRRARRAGLPALRRPHRRRDHLRRLPDRPVRGRVRARRAQRGGRGRGRRRPDDERGHVVRAVVVLRDGHAPSDDLARELQDHVKAQTAPYKYPRIVDFAAELPRPPAERSAAPRWRDQ